ncbi:hypothetical protein IMX26_04895 [Clostridium sp. 'deep sea']|uniref:hypothetical protein n=1 Tax=Clostridium sp. 'deep sea' TaxID=2779445 RepID=UPI00189678AF|nr:hypothetical protein [Clostridium sp. 'deep sea']QOR36153.1 hypothetical protein IMX26_04895 [Clostridium sp. 'deep sea']
MRPENGSAIGRLVDELSWANNGMRDFGGGGFGYDNVLTTEVLQALDYLPRENYLGKIFCSAHGNELTKKSLCKDAEQLNLTILPGNYYLKPNPKTHEEGFAVQPDAILESNKHFIIVEAKRPKRGSFHIKQLARDFVLLTKNSSIKKPALFLILGEKPPIILNRAGKFPIEEAIQIYLKDAIKEAGEYPYYYEEALRKIEPIVLWTTWAEINTIAQEQLAHELQQSSMYNCIERLVNSISYSINTYI